MNMNLEALTQPTTKVNYSKYREFGKGAWGEITGPTLNTPCFMIRGHHMGGPRLKTTPRNKGKGI